MLRFKNKCWITLHFCHRCACSVLRDFPLILRMRRNRKRILRGPPLLCRWRWYNEWWVFFLIKNSNDCHWLCGAGILNLNKNQTGQGNQKSIFFFMCVSWNYSLCRALDDDSRNDSKNLFTYRKVSSSDVKIVSAFRRTNFMVLGPPL